MSHSRYIVNASLQSLNSDYVLSHLVPQFHSKTEHHHVVSYHTHQADEVVGVVSDGNADKCAQKIIVSLFQSNTTVQTWNQARLPLQSWK